VIKFTRQIPGIAALVDAWWLGVEHSLVSLALDEPTHKWLQQQLLPVVYWQTQVEKTKTPALKTAYQQAFRQAQAALCQHPLTGDGDTARVRNLLRLGQRPHGAIPAGLLSRRGPEWLSVTTQSLRQRDADPPPEGNDRDS